MKKSLLAFVALLFIALQGKAQLVISSQNFSTNGAAGTVSGWQTVDNSGNAAGKWKKGANPLNLVNYADAVFKSPTAGNGYAAVISDGVSKAMNTELISPVIDFTGVNHVGIEFSTWLGLKTYPSPTEAQIWATNDGTNWTMVYDLLNSNISATGANGETLIADISSVAANQSTVQVKFTYNATNDVFWLVDDIKFIALMPADAAVTSVDVDEYSPITHAYRVKCTVKNMGVNTLSGIGISYSIDGGAPVEATINTALQSFQSQEYTFSTTSSVSQAGLHNIKVSILSVNSTSDDYADNNTAEKDVKFLGNLPVKNVLMEEFTTAPCGFCPGAAVFLDKALETEGAYTIAVAHHAGYRDGDDPMNIASHSELSTAFGSGAPNGAIDRAIYAGYSDPVNVGLPSLATITQGNIWKELIKQRKQNYFSPMAIQASNSYNAGTRELIVNVNATFYAQMQGDFRVNCFIVEDSVTGGTAYSQLSYYYSSPGANINPWYNKGQSLGSGNSLIHGFVHNKVSRQFMGGTWGTSGIIPATTEAGSTYSKTYTATLPAGWNADHISLVAFVHHYSNNFDNGNNEVINAVKMPLNSSVENDAPQIVLSGINESRPALATMTLQPNPATDHIFVNYTFNQEAKVSFEVYNMMGQLVSTVAEERLQQGSYNTYISTEKLENGIYFLSMKNNNSFVQTIKFVVSK